MKNLKGFSFLALIFIVAGMALFSAAAIYAVKKNPGTFSLTTPQEKAEEKSTESGASGGGKSMAERFLDMVGQKIKSIITPKAPIGNLTPVRDLRGTWKSSLAGKGIQVYGQFKTGPGTTQVYQEGDIKLIITSVENNIASGTIQYTNLCTWGRTTAPKIPTISIPKRCASPSASPIGIRVSGTRLDFGTVATGDTTATMQGTYTTDIITGSMTVNLPAYGVLKGEFHLSRAK
ncbi:MAG: hypothetical protein V1804_01170 [Patescibacteria group bacterium]